MLSVYVSDVCAEREPITNVVYCKDYVCLRFDHHTGVIEWCVGVFDCLFVVAPLLYHCGCDIEEVEVVESLEDSFQFDTMGCVQTYNRHKERCREMFRVPRGYYPCSRCHLLV